MHKHQEKNLRMWWKQTLKYAKVKKKHLPASFYLRKITTGISAILSFLLVNYNCRRYCNKF